jgi:hypothetical protein
VRPQLNNPLHQFRDVNTSSYPDIHLFQDDLDVVLWTLLVADEQLGLSSMTAAHVAEVLTHVYRRSLTRQRAAAVLAAAKGLVARRTKAGQTTYSIMKQRSDRIRTQADGIILIDPSRAFSSLRRLNQILDALSGDVLLCDPYIDDKTLLALTAVPKSSPIKLLTLNISDPPQFRRNLQAYQREYGNLEIRVSDTEDLHDRYIIDDAGMWLLGQSLNGIGKKQTFLVLVGANICQLVGTAFSEGGTRQGYGPNMLKADVLNQNVASVVVIWCSRPRL